MFEEVLFGFVDGKLGSVLINDEEGNIVYKGNAVELSEKAVRFWNRRRPQFDKEENWEFIDKENSKFYQIHSAPVGEGEKRLQCHIFSDVTMYSNLMQELNAYSRQIDEEKKFQDRIMKKLTLSYDSCLAELVSFCHAAQGVLFMESEDGRHAYRSSFISIIFRNKVKMSAELDSYLSGEGEFDDGEYMCYIKGVACNLRYALYLERTPFFNDENFKNVSVRNVVSLFIENSILREKHIYASEHDKLTGLYNKGKFLALKKENFGSPKTLTVFNMDVNNLKTINDTLGHEAGDNLIIKASDSINTLITSDDILGFRTGGDEFILVAKNVDREKAEEMLKIWRNSLNILNSKNDGITITVACGTVTGEGDYNLDEMLAKADEMMYENKKEIKKRLGLPER